VLERLIEEGGFSSETYFYRSALPEHLTPSDKAPGEHFLTANPDPSEAVLDVYGPGHIVLAVHVGPGLAFAEVPDHEWNSDERVNVSVNLQNIIDQGGLIYPVESVTTESVWYFTLPSGQVRVNET
jgi:hypothetical protein